MSQDLKVGIAGFGTIGRVVAKALDEGMEGLVLSGIVSGNEQKARQAMQQLTKPVALLNANKLASEADVVVDCAPTAAFMDIAEPVLSAGKTLITVSGAAILQHPQVVELARRCHGRIILATGAFLGLDAVRAAALGTIYSVSMVTRKPPTSLVKAKYIVENQIELQGLTQPLQVFKGSAAEGSRLFPSNVNVAAALGLAGVGADKTELEIWADPDKTRNTHTIRVDADSASFEMTIENVPTVENPGTGRITALSVIEALRSLTSPLRVGS
ncbi:aspartate dehydrogenase [Lacimicrobium sp. SS2-24]|uniref:aspartate dehydrogenase n=1 Tax=Lacimicrobium sp. SS2-24 TaxID=2005569 RepID=UPI000B4AE55E|nr:aspartate dehydrogenase [Lacimicrobium sp. SS2-24]